MKSWILRRWNLTARAAVTAGLALVSAGFLTGCLNLQLGGGSSHKAQPPTVGQQLMDLQKARDTGAINEAEYQAARAKILSHP